MYSSFGSGLDRTNSFHHQEESGWWGWSKQGRPRVLIGFSAPVSWQQLSKLKPGAPFTKDVAEQIKRRAGILRAGAVPGTAGKITFLRKRETLFKNAWKNFWASGDALQGKIHSLWLEGCFRKLNSLNAASFSFNHDAFYFGVVGFVNSDVQDRDNKLQSIGWFGIRNLLCSDVMPI